MRAGEVDLARDRALVERCQRGDESAFGELYQRYFDRLFRCCLLRLHSESDAEDAAQEAFARAWKAIPRLGGARRFYPWLSVIAANVCTDMLRRSARTGPLDAPAAEQLGRPVEDGAEAVMAAADKEILAEALSRLSPRHAEVLRLREGYEWSYQRIADHEGVEVSTIETLLFRARRALRREFKAVAEAGGLLSGVGLVLRRMFRQLGRMRIGRPPVGTAGASGAGGAAGTAGAGASGVPLAVGAGMGVGAVGVAAAAVVVAATVMSSALAANPTVRGAGYRQPGNHSSAAAQLSHRWVATAGKTALRLPPPALPRGAAHPRPEVAKPSTSSLPATPPVPGSPAPAASVPSVPDAPAPVAANNVVSSVLSRLGSSVGSSLVTSVRGAAHLVLGALTGIACGQTRAVIKASAKPMCKTLKTPVEADKKVNMLLQRLPKVATRAVVPLAGVRRSWRLFPSGASRLPMASSRGLRPRGGAIVPEAGWLTAP